MHGVHKGPTPKIGPITPKDVALYNRKLMYTTYFRN